MRCFIAVPICDAVRNGILRIQESLRRADADVRWAAEPSLHVTLKFLGEIPEDSVVALKELMSAEAARTATFGITYAGVGQFPDRGAPKVLWAGCRGDVRSLVELAGTMERTAEQVGVPPEKRPFSPHLTIGRVRSNRNLKALQAAVENARDTEFGADEVAELRLYQSTLTPQGPIYEALASFPLT